MMMVDMEGAMKSFSNSPLTRQRGKQREGERERGERERTVPVTV